jgi:hypothetical protein
VALFVCFEISFSDLKRLLRQRGRERMEGVGLTRPHGLIVIIDREKGLKWATEDHGERSPECLSLS